MNHFLQKSLVDAQWAAIAAATPTVNTDFVLLNQNVVVGTPQVGFSLLYADNTDRLNVASQSGPTQTIAYVSDIPPPAPAPSQIDAPDNNSQVICGNGGVTVIQNQSTGISVFSSSIPGETTVMGCPDGSAYFSANNTGDLEIKTNYAIKMQGINWSINGVFYPGTDGQAGQVLTTNGSNNVTWQRSTPGIFSQVSPVSCTNTAALTALSTGGYGFFTFPANTLFAGDVFNVQASGVFRNRNASQTLRIILLANLSAIWDSGVFTMPSVNTVRPWTLLTTLFYDGSTMTSNGQFSYRNGANAFAGACATNSATITATIPHALTLLVQWGAANINNTLTLQNLSLSRVF